ncbi:MAG: rRNA maturation RNase YbeY [Patescibacteria group bacterium]
MPVRRQSGRWQLKKIARSNIAILNISNLSLPNRWTSQCLQLIKRALKQHNLTQYEISVALVKPATIRELNQSYRRNHQVTDVLSFIYDKTAKQINGEIVICLSQALKQAKRKKHNLARELNILVVHGTLHLLGYDHKTVKERRLMRQQETERIP